MGWNGRWCRCRILYVLWLFLRLLPTYFSSLLILSSYIKYCPSSSQYNSALDVMAYRFTDYRLSISLTCIIGQAIEIFSVQVLLILRVGICIVPYPWFAYGPFVLYIKNLGSKNKFLIKQCWWSQKRIVTKKCTNECMLDRPDREINQRAKKL